METGRIWFIYLIRCHNGNLYTGITTDVSRRFQEHLNNTGRGAKYLRGKGPLKLAWHVEIGGRSLALKLENRVKKLSKREKELLISDEIDFPALQNILAETS